MKALWYPQPPLWAQWLARLDMAGWDYCPSAGFTVG